MLQIWCILDSVAVIFSQTLYCLYMYIFLFISYLCFTACLDYFTHLEPSQS